eukprot:2749416-Rhodomonas_salina.2
MARTGASLRSRGLLRSAGTLLRYVLRACYAMPGTEGAWAMPLYQDVSAVRNWARVEQRCARMAAMPGTATGAIGTETGAIGTETGAIGVVPVLRQGQSRAMCAHTSPTLPTTSL